MIRLIRANMSSPVTMTQFSGNCCCCHLFTKYLNVIRKSLTFRTKLLINSCNNNCSKDCPEEGQNRFRCAVRRGSENLVVNNQSPAVNSTANCPKLGCANRDIGTILCFVLNTFAALFLGWILSGFSDGFGIDSNIIIMIDFNIFGHLFEFWQMCTAPGQEHDLRGFGTSFSYCIFMFF